MTKKKKTLLVFAQPSPLLSCWPGPYSMRHTSSLGRLTKTPYINHDSSIQHTHTRLQLGEISAQVEYDNTRAVQNRAGGDSFLYFMESLFFLLRTPYYTSVILKLHGLCHFLSICGIRQIIIYHIIITFSIITAPAGSLTWPFSHYSEARNGWQSS